MIRFLISVLVLCVLGWIFCDINPEETYTWYSGIWQGIFFIPNWIRSLFTGALYKAQFYTAGYNACYWIFAVISTVSTVCGGGWFSWRR